MNAATKLDDARYILNNSLEARRNGLSGSEAKSGRAAMLGTPTAIHSTAERLLKPDADCILRPVDCDCAQRICNKRRKRKTGKNIH